MHCQKYCIDAASAANVSGENSALYSTLDDNIQQVFLAMRRFVTPRVAGP